MLAFGLLSAVLGISAVPQARAYVPPSFFVVRMLAHKHATFDDARFRGKLTFYRKSGEASATLNETLIFPDAEHVVLRLDDTAGNEVAHQTRKLVSNGKDGDQGRPALYDLLYVRDGGSIFEHLKQLGLPLKPEAALYQEKEAQLPYKPEPTVNYERFEGRIAVVVGDRSKKGDLYSSPSLWVEKDSYLPLRAVLPESGSSAQPLEYRMSGFTSYKAFLYPRTIQIFKTGQLWAKIETQEARGAGKIASDDGAPKIEAGGDLKDDLDAYLRWVR